MPRARPRRLSAVLVALVASLSAGCVTRAIWEKWPESPEPTPVRIERAIRTGTGSFHVEALFSDGSRRHLAIRPFASPSGEEWPDAIRRADIIAELDEPLPDGPPLRVEGAPADDDGQALDAGDDGPLESIALEQGALRVTNPTTGTWTLATFPPPRESTFAEVAHDYHLRVAILGLTPVAAACDAVIGVVLFGPLAPATLLADD